MNIRELNKPINSKTLNETLSKKFGTKINVEQFTLEQLQDARNKIRTKLSDIETNESFAGLSQNETYSKNKLFLDVLNAAISERADVEVEEKAKPDYIDIDGDGDKKEPMKKAAKDAKKDKKVNEFDGVDSTDDSDQNLMRSIQQKFGTKSGRNLGRFAGGRYRDGYGDPADLDVALDDPAVKMMIDAGVLTLNPSALKKYKAMYGESNVEEGKGADFEGKFRKIQNRGGSIAYAIHDLIQSYGLDADKIMGFNPQVDQRKVRQFQIDRQEKVLQMVKQQLGESIVREGEEDKAELVMAAKDMVDRLTGWMEDTAEMQSESMLELADAIRDEMGAQQSEQFTATVKPALEQLYAAMETTRGSLTQGVGMLTGEAETAEPMGAEPAAEPNIDMEPTVDTDDVADDFAAAEAAVGGEDEAGRAKRESINLSRRLGTILSSKK